MLFLVVRESDDFSRVLEQNGFPVINCPTIKTTPSEDLLDFEEQLCRLDSYDGIFLTSRKATEIFRRELREAGIAFKGKVHIFGRRGYNLLKNEGLDLYFNESAGTVQEMLEKLEPSGLKNKCFLIICGENSLSVVSEYLSRSSQVEEAVVYRTAKITVEPSLRDEIRLLAVRGEIGFACFFSPSGADSFLQQLGDEVLAKTKIAVIGKTTADYFENRNLKVDFISEKPTAGDFANGLIEYLKQIEFHERANGQ